MTAAKRMAHAQAEIEALVLDAPPMRELQDELRRYPVRLLRQLAAEFRRRQGAVPDHALELAPYVGETALRALVASGLAEQVLSPYAVRAYKPTQLALDLLQRLAREA